MQLTFKEGRQGKIHISIDGEYKLTVDGDYFSSLGINNKTEITDEELAELTVSVNSRRAFNKACDLLSRRDHSEKELRDKLRQKGFAEGTDVAIEKLRGYGYIDNIRFAENYANDLKKFKGYGKRRIIDELRRKGIDRDIINDITENMDFGIDEIVCLIKRKYKNSINDEKGLNRTINGLIRYGYSYSEIKDALRLIKDEQEFGDDDEIYDE